jgi:hypothetical protein
MKMGTDWPVNRPMHVSKGQSVEARLGDLPSTEAWAGSLPDCRRLAQNHASPSLWGLFDLALHQWKQTIEKIWPIEGLKLWSLTPGVPSEVIQGVELRSEWWR